MSMQHDHQHLNAILETTLTAAFANWSTSEQDIPLIIDALERCARA